MKTDKIETLRKAVHWSFLAVTIAFVASGYGITEYRTVEALTFGLLSKQLSFAMHGALTIPFVLLLALHLFLTAARKRLKKRE